MQRFASALRSTTARSVVARATTAAPQWSAMSSLTQRRPFHSSLFSASPATSTPSSAAAAAASAVSTAETPYADDAIIHGESAGIMQKYGWYPLLGLGGAIAVSKELLILNEEFVIVFTFGSFCALSYIYGWESVATSLDKQCNDIREEIVTGYNEKEKMLEESITQLSRFSNLQAAVTHAEQDAMKRNASVAQYKTNKYKVDLYADIDKAMSELSQRQSNFDRDTQVTMSAATLDIATKSWTDASAAVKASYVDTCIANMRRSGDTTNAATAAAVEDPLGAFMASAIDTKLPLQGLKEHQDAMFTRSAEMGKMIYEKYPGKVAAEAAEKAAYDAMMATATATAAENAAAIETSANADPESMGGRVVKFNFEPTGWTAAGAAAEKK